MKHPLSTLTTLSTHLAAQAWQPELDMPKHTRSWLLATASLTERLVACSTQFRVELIQQASLPLLPAEQDLLPTDSYDVREVILCDGERPLVFARSVIPHTLCAGEFVGLGNQPLGKILFNDARFVRQPFLLTRIAQDSPFASAWHAQHDLWGRSSIFTFSTDGQGEQHILVAEYFLPHSPAYTGCESELELR
jgi:chorismate--pyruvate lyase